MSKVFVSYSHEDAKLAKVIGQRLEDAGNQVWVPKLSPGDDIRTVFDDAISSSDAVVVLLSPNFLRSGWTSMELAAALASATAQAGPRVVPVLADSKTEVPPFLTGIQYADASDPKNRDKALDAIARAVAESSRSPAMERDLDTAFLQLQRERELLDLSRSRFEHGRKRDAALATRSWLSAVAGSLLAGVATASLLGVSGTGLVVAVITLGLGVIIGRFLSLGEVNHEQ